MSELPNAIREDAPAPWWPCPACGAVHFKVVCTFERGWWLSETNYVHVEPPMGRPTGVQVSAAECVDCGTVTNLHEHYGWPPAVGEWSDE